ncbi:hypothetical protein LBMAG21_07590 [Armatimonadota bacterium]|nr:hypothetical protein LBMAG21_07590 [Armatimonadota bacterium]
MKQIIVLATLGTLLLVGAPRAQAADTYNFTIDSAKSKLDINNSVNVTTQGYLIGQYDATTNATGTRTKNGLTGSFPSTTNEQVTSNPALAIGGPMNASASGTYKAAIDTSKLTISISNFSVNYLSSGSLSQTVAMTLNTGNFRTASPNYAYPAGALTVPAGTLSITALTATQKANTSGVGKLTSLGNGSYSFTAALTATMNMSFKIFGTGPYPVQVPIVMTLTGTLTKSSDGTYTVSTSNSINANRVIDVNFTAPKFGVGLPAGTSKAYVWVNMTVKQVSAAVSGTCAFVAIGVKQ